MFLIKNKLIYLLFILYIYVIQFILFFITWNSFVFHFKFKFILYTKTIQMFSPWKFLVRVYIYINCIHLYLSYNYCNIVKMNNSLYSKSHNVLASYIVMYNIICIVKNWYYLTFWLLINLCFLTYTLLLLPT